MMHVQFEASSSVRLTRDYILGLPPVMVFICESPLVSAYSFYFSHTDFVSYVCNAVISLRILKIFWGVFFPSLLSVIFSKLFVSIAVFRDRFSSGVWGSLIILYLWVRKLIGILGSLSGWWLLTSHLNIDPTVESHFSCLIQGHPEVTVFRLFLLEWFASPKIFQSSGLAASVLGARWGKGAGGGTSTSVTMWCLLKTPSLFSKWYFFLWSLRLLKRSKQRVSGTREKIVKGLSGNLNAFKNFNSIHLACCSTILSETMMLHL